MQILENENVLVLRFKDYKHYSFIKEHESIIKKQGHVWMLKIGKSLTLSSVKKVMESNASLLLRAPKALGGEYYFAKMEDCFNGAVRVDMNYPEYYKDMMDNYDVDSLSGTWIKMTVIKRIEKDKVKNIVLSKNNREIDTVFNETRTSVLYAKSLKDIDV